jgi:peptide/nickel transport system permease protein
MRAYIARRLLLIIPSLFIVTIIVFLSVRLIPGSIVDIMVNEAAMQGVVTVDREAIEEALGLDVPIHIQYGRWIGDIFLHGSLGESLRDRQPVAEEIFSRLPVTFELGVLALIVALLIAIPIGIYSAIRQDTVGDYVMRSIAIIFISVPSFWIGTMIMIYPSIWWDWSPSMELIKFSDDPLGNLGMFIIPAVILGMALSGVTMRMMRTMMLEVLRQDYIRTAWSKGLNERVVIIRHALKNALIPVITLIGYQMTFLIAGSVIVEQIFVLPGVGRLMLEALSQRDYPIVSGINLFVATAVLGRPQDSL